MSATEWSKQEKEIARRAFKAAYSRECMAIAESVRKMASEINDPIGLWQLHDFLTEKRKETDEKYDFRYSVLPLVFARLLCEGWIKQEDLAGISEQKLQEIRKAAEFMRER
ncbi:Uncharacterised protein [uncultured archaeon]|nr:Uncharacterised protein [uncultured archaeon]